MRKTSAPITIKALFAKSGNCCAFPGCRNSLIKNDSLFIGEIAHIEAAEAGGTRFNPKQSDDERRGYGNLILLCHEHHVEIDADAGKYSVRMLKRMKLEHARSVKIAFKVKPSVIKEIRKGIEVYWSNVDRVNSCEHVLPERAIKIDSKADFLKLLSDVADSIHKLSKQSESLASADSKLNEQIREHFLVLGYNLEKYDSIPYYENPFFNRNWETHCLGMENCFRIIHVRIAQLRLKCLEERIMAHPRNKLLLQEYSKAKTAFEQMARGSGIAD